MGAAGSGCDPVSGQCQCKPGVFGKHCDRCLPAYFQFAVDGCRFCQCDPSGALAGNEYNLAHY
jgi:hypothetical protein